MANRNVFTVLILLLGLVGGYWLAGKQEKLFASAQADYTTTNAVFSYADAVKQAAPAVVNIHTKTVIKQKRTFFDDPIFDLLFGEKSNDLPNGSRTKTNLGSGVIVNKNGLLLTNNHVIKGADQILIGLQDGRSAVAKIVGADYDSDLAVLKIELDKLPVIQFADSDKLQVGDVALAIGNPFGVGQTVTMGIVSATDRSQLGISRLENFIQTDAAINPGNSGGALTDAKGNLIGINIAIFSKSGASHGIGFAIPANAARDVLEQIIKTGAVQRGWVGIESKNLTSELVESFGFTENSGVLITGVYDNSPAKRTGLKPGDIITHLNGKPISDSVQWSKRIAVLKPGNNANIRLVRENKPYDLTIRTTNRPKKLR